MLNTFYEIENKSRFSRHKSPGTKLLDRSHNHLPQPQGPETVTLRKQKFFEFKNQPSFVFNVRTPGRTKSNSFFVSYATFPDFELKFVLSSLTLSDIPTYLRTWISNEINSYLEENNLEKISLSAPFPIAQAIFQQTPLLASKKPWYKIPKYFIPAGIAVVGTAFLVINALHETGPPATDTRQSERVEKADAPAVQPAIDTTVLKPEPAVRAEPATPGKTKSTGGADYAITQTGKNDVSAPALRDSVESRILENNYIFRIDRQKRIILVGPKAGNWKAPFIGVSKNELKKVNPVVGCECGALVELKDIEFTLSTDVYVDSIVAKRALYPPATKGCYYWLHYDSLPRFVIYGDTSDFNKTFRTDIARDR